MHTTKEICATNDAILGVDCWHFSVVYFQMCHNLREREQEKVRKLSKEFPTVKFGRVKLWIFWASKVFFFFRSGWMNTKWILSQIKTIEIRNIYLAVEREKKNHPVPNDWIDGAFFFELQNQNQFEWMSYMLELVHFAFVCVSYRLRELTRLLFLLRNRHIHSDASLFDQPFFSLFSFISRFFCVSFLIFEAGFSPVDASQSILNGKIFKFTWVSSLTAHKRI